jgi:hypothetical protein
MSPLEQEFMDSLMSYFEDAGNILTPWEKEFMTDTKTRYDKYGPDTRVSVKQWAVLKRIGVKFGIEEV